MFKERLGRFFTTWPDTKHIVNVSILMFINVLTADFLRVWRGNIYIYIVLISSACTAIKIRNCSFTKNRVTLHLVALGTPALSLESPFFNTFLDTSYLTIPCSLCLLALYSYHGIDFKTIVLSSVIMISALQFLYGQRA